jgi:hypothetical protein
VRSHVSTGSLSGVHSDRGQAQEVPLLYCDLCLRTFRNEFLASVTPKARLFASLDSCSLLYLGGNALRTWRLEIFSFKNDKLTLLGLFSAENGCETGHLGPLSGARADDRSRTP